MGYWSLVLSLLFIIAAVFFLRKLWMGALAAVMLLLIEKMFLSGNQFEPFVDLLNGLLISIELALLVIGAYLFYNILRSGNHFQSFTAAAGGFSSIVPAMLILVWFFGSFMEGIAGFGIPAMLIAPLMMSLGYKPLTSMALAVAGNTTPVTFGALGTSLKIGLGIHAPDAVTELTLLVNLVPALLMPALLTVVLSLTEKKRIEWKKEWKTLLGAGICFVLPYEIAGRFTVEFATVIAGASGLLLFVLIFIPQYERPSLRLWWQLFWPYLMLTLLLLFFRYTTNQFSWKLSDAVRAIKLYQPGLVFVLAGVCVLLLVSPAQLYQKLEHELKNTLTALKRSIFTLILLACFAQLIRGDISLLSALFFEKAAGSALVIVPSAGVIGSFITGSATMSNLLLYNSLQSADFGQEGFRVLLTVLLHTGSCIGNAIAFQNMVMVKSVVNSDISEARIFRNNLIVAGVYWGIVVITGWIFFRQL